MSKYTFEILYSYSELDRGPTKCTYRYPAYRNITLISISADRKKGFYLPFCKKPSSAWRARLTVLRHMSVLKPFGEREGPLNPILKKRVLLVGQWINMPCWGVIEVWKASVSMSITADFNTFTFATFPSFWASFTSDFLRFARPMAYWVKNYVTILKDIVWDFLGEEQILNNVFSSLEFFIERSRQS